MWLNTYMISKLRCVPEQIHGIFMPNCLRYYSLTYPTQNVRGFETLGYLEGFVGQLDVVVLKVESCEICPGYHILESINVGILLSVVP